ncbi:MAG TPA: PilT/PilU family type 4a pilus ATPase [Thermoanaerobaculia bacterium]|nr:PilT/PilU family type 4a pilus ATPase [Thermoanaerobaculia bacterium]
MSHLDLEDGLAFGVIAIELGMLSRDQLTDALAAQAEAGGALGEILVAQDLLTERQIEEVLALQRLRRAGHDGAATFGSSRGSPAQTPAPPQITDVAGSGPGQAAGLAYLQPLATATTIEPADPVAAGLVASGDQQEASPEPAESPGGRPPADAAILRTLRQLVEAARRHAASTIHLHAGLPPSLRIHGDLRPLKGRAFDPAACEAMARALLDDDQLRALEARGQVDLAYDVEGLARLRVNVYRQQRGVDLVLRLIPREAPSLDSLGLPAAVGEVASLPRGMVLFTGPGGCGKSTTMAAVVDLVNANRPGTILTIEDPVEYVHTPKRSVVRQRQIGRDASTFERALRAALRQDPNVIVLGELRDRETIGLALTAAETGHLVLATLHTSNAAATISRLVGAFPPDQQRQVRTMLGESLRAVVSQRLVRRADGTGRVAALEILLGTPAVANLIRENKLQQIPSALQSGSSKGMTSLGSSLERLVESGIVDRAEAALHSESPSTFDAPRVAAESSA